MTRALFPSRQISVTAPLAGVPAWASGLAVNQGVSIPGTDPTAWRSTKAAPVAVGASFTGSSINGFFAYCGACVRHSDATWFTGLGGGHGDYHGNDHGKIKLSDDAPTWTDVQGDHSSDMLVNEPYHRNPARPSARHSYWHIQFIQSQNSLVHLFNVSTSGNGGAFHRTCDSFSLSTMQWSPQGATAPYTTWPGGAGQPGARAQYQGGTQAFFLMATYAPNDQFYVIDPSGATNGLHRYDAIADVWTQFPMSLPVTSKNTPLAYDSTRNRLLWLNLGTAARIIDPIGNTVSTVTLGESFIEYCTMEYVPEIDRFVTLNWSGQGQTNQLRLIHPTTFAVTTITPGGLVTNSTGSGGEIYGKFKYVPNIGGGVGGVAVCYGSGHNMAFVRLF